MVQVDERGKVFRSSKNRQNHCGRWAITGFISGRKGVRFCGRRKASARGEIEIVSILERYLAEDELSTEMLHRGFGLWLDAGTHESLQQASISLKLCKIGKACWFAHLKKLAYRMKLISLDQLSRLDSDLKTIFIRALCRQLCSRKLDRIMAEIPFNRSPLLGREKEYVEDAIGRRRLSGDGFYTKAVSGHVETTIGAAEVYLTHSCTAALEMAALLIDLGPGG